MMTKSFSKGLNKRITDRTVLIAHHSDFFTKCVSNHLLTRKQLSKTLVLYNIYSPPCCH